MNAEILSVGTELLLGDIVNTNAQYIAKQLAGLGIGVFFQTVVGDNPERACQAFEIAFGRADIVITTGGLGPTKDDLTKEMAAKYFGKELVLHQESYDRVVGFMTRQSFPMTENNKKQGYIIDGSQPIQNDNGTAPGIIFEENGKILIMLPGPPNEMIPMFNNSAVPFLKTKTDKVFVSKTLRLCGIGESSAETKIKDLIDNQTNPTIAPYAKTSEVHFRVTASAGNEAEAKKIMRPTIDKMYEIFGDNIYAEDERTHEETIVKMLIEKGVTIACAESCTGGLLTAALINVPDCSKVVLEGAVVYSNGAKMNRVNVSEKTLEKFGAVSKETAEEMAKGIALTSGAKMGVSTTGIAGPGGAAGTKEVGLVYISVYYNGKTYTKEQKLLGNRQKVRDRAVVIALDFIRRILLNNK